MGNGQTGVLRVGFEPRLRLAFQEATISSDAGLLVYRELDETVKLTESAVSCLFDSRIGGNISHTFAALLRQSVYSRLAGYENVNDADRLSIDPVMCQVIGGRAANKQEASASQVARFETKVLTEPGNLEALMGLPGRWVESVRERQPVNKLVLDMDSSVSPTHGDQEGSDYNGHFGCEGYHPRFVINQDGDVERALLRKGNVAGADDWRSVLEPVIARYRPRKIEKYFRGDAAFAIPGLYELLEAEGYRYAIRLKANPILEQQITHLLARPVGRPSHKPLVRYDPFTYQAKSWDKPRGSGQRWFATPGMSPSRWRR